LALNLTVRRRRIELTPFKIVVGIVALAAAALALYPLIRVLLAFFIVDGRPDLTGFLAVTEVRNVWTIIWNTISIVLVSGASSLSSTAGIGPLAVVSRLVTDDRPLMVPARPTRVIAVKDAECNTSRCERGRPSAAPALPAAGTSRHPDQMWRHLPMTAVADRWDGAAEFALHYDITKALARNARGVDRKDWDLMLSTYHEHAVDDHGSFAGPPNEFAEFLASRAEFIETIVHFLGQTLILEVDRTDRSVLVETSCVGWQVLSERAPEIPYLFELGSVTQPGVSAMGVRYVDLLTEREGELRIQRRTVVYEWASAAANKGPEFFTGKLRGLRSMEDFSYGRDGGFAAP
jgi:hypothetical protein